MNNTDKSNRGFTLIELIVAMAILVGVVIAVGGALSLFTRSMDTTTQIVDDQSEARLTMMTLVKEIRSASNVDVIGALDGSNEARGLLLTHTGIDEDGNPTEIETRYWVDPGADQLMRQIDTAASASTGIRIKSFRTRIEWENNSGWLYIIVRSDATMLLDTKIALNRLNT